MQIDYQFQLPMLREAKRCFKQFFEQKVVVELYELLTNMDEEDISEYLIARKFPNLYQAELDFEYALLGSVDEMNQLKTVSPPIIFEAIYGQAQSVLSDLEKNISKQEIIKSIKTATREKVYYQKHWNGELRPFTEDIEPDSRIAKLLSESDHLQSYLEFVTYRGNQLLNSISRSNQDESHAFVADSRGTFFIPLSIDQIVKDVDAFKRICEILCKPIPDKEIRKNGLPILQPEGHGFALVGVKGVGIPTLASIIIRMIELKIYSFPSNRTAHAEFFLEYFNIASSNSRLKQLSKLIGNEEHIEQPLKLIRKLLPKNLMTQ